jgi:hypothetical protein
VTTTLSPRQLLEVGSAIAEQDRDLVDDHLIEHTRGERLDYQFIES